MSFVFGVLGGGLGAKYMGDLGERIHPDRRFGRDLGRALGMVLGIRAGQELHDRLIGR